MTYSHFRRVERPLRVRLAGSAREIEVAAEWLKLLGAADLTITARSKTRYSLQASVPQQHAGAAMRAIATGDWAAVQKLVDALVDSGA